MGASLGSCRNPDIGLVPLGPHRPPPSRGCRDVPALPGGNGHVAESPQPRGPLARLPPAARGRLRVFTPSRRTDRSTLGAASCLQSAVRIKLMTKASRSPEALRGSRTRFTEARITPASSESTLCPWPENGARTRRKTRETVDRPAIWAACPAGRAAPWCWAPHTRDQALGTVSAFSPRLRPRLTPQGRLTPNGDRGPPSPWTPAPRDCEVSSPSHGAAPVLVGGLVGHGPPAGRWAPWEHAAWTRPGPGGLGLRPRGTSRDILTGAPT